MKSPRQIRFRLHAVAEGPMGLLIVPSGQEAGNKMELIYFEGTRRGIHVHLYNKVEICA